jgi:hypothetical protein
MNSTPKTLPIIRKPASTCLGCRRGIRVKYVRGVAHHIGEHGTMDYICRGRPVARPPKEAT